jgi:hypothetical protein
MAPKKRKVAAASAETKAQQVANPDHIAVLNKRLEEIDAAGKHPRIAQTVAPGCRHAEDGTPVLQLRIDAKQLKLQQTRLWPSSCSSSRCNCCSCPKR